MLVRKDDHAVAVDAGQHIGVVHRARLHQVHAPAKQGLQIGFCTKNRVEPRLNARRKLQQKIGVWGDMAILCRYHSEMDLCADVLARRGLPHQLRRNSSSVFNPAHDSIKVMTLHVSKGLEFPVVALVGAGRMPAEGENEREEARLFYVGATRATRRLVIGASENGKFAVRILAKGKTRPQCSCAPYAP